MSILHKYHFIKWSSFPERQHRKLGFNRKKPWGEKWSYWNHIWNKDIRSFHWVLYLRWKGLLSVFFPVKCYFQYPIMNVWVLHYKSCQTYWCCSKTRRDSSALLLKVWPGPATMVFPESLFGMQICRPEARYRDSKSAFWEDPKLVKNRRDWKALLDPDSVRISTFSPFCLELFILYRFFLSSADFSPYFSKWVHWKQYAITLS